MRCPKSRFPIRIIVFDKLELIVFVSQGLTLSTASLVEILQLVLDFDKKGRSNQEGAVSLVFNILNKLALCKTVKLLTGASVSGL